VDIRYALFKDMSRTTKAPLDNTTRDSTGKVTHIGTNQIGRYSLHMHHLYGPANPTNTGYQFQLIGNAIDSGKKWGIVVHDTSFGLIQDNVVYKVQGGGIVTEDGSETGNVFAHNMSAFIEDGDAFWIQGIGNDSPR